jgi:ubiquinol-cytochrome c reductase cytochrome c1 subunit
MAKDVTTFLSWAAEPEHDERKKYGVKAVIIFSALFTLSLYVKRFKWGVIKNRKISENLIFLWLLWLIQHFTVYNPPANKTH